jgi:hypothetical protein
VIFGFDGWFEVYLVKPINSFVDISPKLTQAAHVYCSCLIIKNDEIYFCLGRVLSVMVWKLNANTQTLEELITIPGSKT